MICPTDNVESKPFSLKFFLSQQTVCITQIRKEIKNFILRVYHFSHSNELIFPWTFKEREKTYCTFMCG